MCIRDRLGVNLWGVIHGIRSFVPRMLDQGGPAHVVNTASMAGLISVPYLGAYNVSKHGVVTLSETLHRDLGLAGSDIGVSVLCPGLVMTNIFESQRNRPDELADDDGSGGLSELLDGVGDSAGAEDAVGAFGQILSPDDVGPRSSTPSARTASTFSPPREHRGSGAHSLR